MSYFQPFGFHFSSDDAAAPPQLATPAGTCSRNPPGFVCSSLKHDVISKLPAGEGQRVVCAPLSSQTDFDAIIQKVLPHTFALRNSINPTESRVDLRFKYFPTEYPFAFSKCCNGQLLAPSTDPEQKCVANLSKWINPSDMINSATLRQKFADKYRHLQLDKNLKDNIQAPFINRENHKNIHLLDAGFPLPDEGVMFYEAMFYVNEYGGEEALTDEEPEL